MADLVSVIVGPVSLLVGIGISELRQWRLVAVGLNTAVYYY